MYMALWAGGPVGRLATDMPVGATRRLPPEQPESWAVGFSLSDEAGHGASPSSLFSR